MKGTVRLGQLSLGAVLAEGGEGRVFEVAGPGPPLVFKQLRRLRAADELAAVVGFLPALEASSPALAARVRSSCAWPLAVVEAPGQTCDGRPGAIGVLMPRAPGHFWARHRDGRPRLASLSYLATDPDRIAVAYGVAVPAPGSAERVAIVYALCRLLEAWQGGAEASPPRATAAHGDLSAKNILWSLVPAPAVYVLDCDGAALRGPGPGTAPSGRATTPNWEDPSETRGAPPSLASDRYAIGLAFLRVVGAANFPLQGRQRAAETVDVDMELPRSWRHLPDMPALWELCARSLSLRAPLDRPTPGEWAAQLDQLLAALGAHELGARARAAQGGPSGEVVPAHAPSRSAPPGDVVVRPVIRQRVAPTWQLVRGASPAGGPGDVAGAAAALGAMPPRQLLRRSFQAWGSAHRLAITLVRSPGRRAHGARRLLGVLAMDIAGACALLFLVGMVVSPWIGL